MTDRLRNQTDGQKPRRVPRGDNDAVTNLEDVSDPTTRPDESKDTLRERILSGAGKAKLLAYSSLLVALLIVLTLLVVTFAPAILTNPWIQRLAIVAVLVGVGVYIGTKRERGMLTNHAMVVELRPGGCRPWWGDYDQESKTLKPRKGFGLLGAGDYYTYEDLGSRFADAAERYGKDPEDPAEIRYLEGTVQSTDTFLGTVAAVPTRGHRPVWGQGESAIIAEPPHTGHKESINDMSKELERAHSKIKDKNDEIADLQEERDKYRAKAKETHQEAMRRLLNMGESFALINDGRRSNREPQQERPPAQQPEIFGGED